MMSLARTSSFCWVSPWTLMLLGRAEDVGQSRAANLVGDHFRPQAQVVEDARELTRRLRGVTLFLLDDEPLDRDDRNVSVMNHGPPPGSGAATARPVALRPRRSLTARPASAAASSATRVTAAPSGSPTTVAGARLVEDEVMTSSRHRGQPQNAGSADRSESYVARTASSSAFSTARLTRSPRARQLALTARCRRTSSARQERRRPPGKGRAGRPGEDARDSIAPLLLLRRQEHRLEVPRPSLNAHHPAWPASRRAPRGASLAAACCAPARHCGRWRSASRAGRSTSPSGTVSLGGKRVAAVPARGENLNVYASSNPTHCTADRVSAKSASVSPGNPTMNRWSERRPGMAAPHAIDTGQILLTRVAPQHASERVRRARLHGQVHMLADRGSRRHGLENPVAEVVRVRDS